MCRIRAYICPVAIIHKSDTRTLYRARPRHYIYCGYNNIVFLTRAALMAQIMIYCHLTSSTLPQCSPYVRYNTYLYVIKPACTNKYCCARIRRILLYCAYDENHEIVCCRARVSNDAKRSNSTREKSTHQIAGVRITTTRGPLYIDAQSQNKCIPNKSVRPLRIVVTGFGPTAACELRSFTANNILPENLQRSA